MKHLIITYSVISCALCLAPCAAELDAAHAAARSADWPAAKTGIPAANIVIAATHTHGGPEYYGPLRDVLHARAMQANDGKDPCEPLDYQTLLVDRWVDVIAKAHAACRAAKLSVVVPRQHGMAFNRRFLLKDGSTGWNPGKLNPNIARPLGPTDPDLPFLLARDALSDEPLGSLTVFAMHTAIVTLPHEVFVELGMAIKSASPFRTTIVVSLANDIDFYVPTRRAFEEGNYEPTACPLSPGCGELLVQAAVKLLNDLKP